MEVGNTPVRTAREFREAIDSYDLEDGVRLTVIQEGVVRYALLKTRD